MPNKPRPNCPNCKLAMAPLFQKRPKGDGFARAGESFRCPKCRVLAGGRKKTAFIDEKGLVVL